MIEVTFVFLVAILLWVITGLFFYGWRKDVDDSGGSWGVIGIVVGTISTILTLVGLQVLIVV